MTDTHFRLRVSAILETAICDLRKVAEQYVTAMEAERANWRNDVLWKDYPRRTEQQIHEATVKVDETGKIL